MKGRGKILIPSSDNPGKGFFAIEMEIFDQIINHSRAMISIINREYVYEKVNDTFCREHQIISDSIIGKSLADLWGIEAFEKNIKANIDKCFSGETVNYEGFFDTPRLGKRHYEVVFRPLKLHNSGISHLMAETVDIHELRISRQKVLEKEEELRMIETNLPIGLLRCNPDGRIIQANKAFLQIMGCPNDIILHELNLRNFYISGSLFDIHMEQLSGLHSKSFGRVFLKKWTGDEIACRISGFMAFDQSQKPSYIDLAVEDSSRELLLEEKLFQAKKMETIGALAGGIAHDFNNILATISGYSELLMEDLPEGSPNSDKVCRIQGAVQRAHSIINQILTFSRHIEQDKIPVSVGEILTETVGLMKSVLPPGVQIKKSIPKNNPEVMADPTQLFRVFLNLMNNAVQAMEEKGGILTVEVNTVSGTEVRHHTKKDLMEDEYIEIVFRDTGEGMDQSVAERIFEPFFTTREVGKGIGLGLSVVHGIITEMEGEIVFSSHREEGSVFHVYLPVGKEQSDHKKSKKGRKNILFITGNKHESKVLAIALEKTGYNLLYITDSSHLVKTIQTTGNKPDLIIYMPESTQVSPRDIVSIYTGMRVEIPFILISGDDPQADAEKMLNSGIISQRLVKPVSLKELKDAISLLLD
jgi:two-component system cell cycle sensor histidine kinase/response regulator CckA